MVPFARAIEVLITTANAVNRIIGKAQHPGAHMGPSIGVEFLRRWDRTGRLHPQARWPWSISDSATDSMERAGG